MATNTAMQDENSNHCRFTYTALIFPKGVKLDNSVLSMEQVLERKMVPMVCEEKESKIGQNIFGAILYWQIAEKNNARRITIQEEEEDVALALFRTLGK